MELLHLLASLQILPRLVSPAGKEGPDPHTCPTLLPPARVVVDPQDPVYFLGERLTLRCSAPGGEAVTSYQFYNQRGEQVHMETTGLSGGPWLVLTAEMGKAGAYSCEYWAVRHGRHICSVRSQPVQVLVMGESPFSCCLIGISLLHPHHVRDPSLAPHVWGGSTACSFPPPGSPALRG
ncbi:unnamed protein product [Lepidochelys olivacea]